MSHNTKILGLGKKIFFLIIVFFLLFLIVETGWRTYLYFSGRGFFDDPKEFTSPFFTTYEEPLPFRYDTEFYYRNGMISQSKAPNEIRIICFGGSTTVNARAGISYPELLEKRFSSPREEDVVRILNAGGEGFSTAHTLVNLALRNLDVEPDGIVVYHNINDLSAIWWPGDVTSDYASKYKSDFYLGFRHRIGVVAELTKVSRLARYIFSNIMAIRFPAREKRDDVSHKQGLKYFKHNLRSIIAVARSHGISVLLASQAAKSDFRNHEGFLAYNQAVKAVAEEEGVAFVDIAGAMTEDTLFLNDSFHYTRKGVEKLSDEFFNPLYAMVEDIKKAKQSR